MTALQNKVALVTGAARGIGAAVARRLRADGAVVIRADIDPLDGERRLDIADEASVAALAEWLRAAHGRLDILVNNAAILDATPTAALTMQRYRHVIDVNLDGAVRVTLALRPLLLAAPPGARIVNVASIMGVRGSRDSVPYSTAKGGLVNLTRALACDLGPHGLCVNAVAPGFIDTRMALLPDGSGHEHETEWFRDIYLRHGRIALGRAGQPDDIAGPVAFLCSDDARYVTGQVLLVDGGVSATF